MTAFLRAEIIPVARSRLVERFESLECDAVLVAVESTHIEQVFAECIVVFGTKVVDASVAVATRAAADCHPVGCRVRECLKHGVGSALLYLQHYFPLSGIGIPVVWFVRSVLETGHFGAFAFSLCHVSVDVRRIVAPADVISENVHVKVVVTDNHVDKLVDGSFILPLAAHMGPPAERCPPAFDLLASGVGVNIDFYFLSISKAYCGYCSDDGYEELFHFPGCVWLTCANVYKIHEILDRQVKEFFIIMQFRGFA